MQQNTTSQPVPGIQRCWPDAVIVQKKSPETHLLHPTTARQLAGKLTSPALHTAERLRKTTAHRHHE